MEVKYLPSVFSDADENQEATDPYTAFLTESGSDDQITGDTSERSCKSVAKKFRHILGGTEIRETLKLCYDAVKYTEINPEIVRTMLKKLLLMI